MSYLNTPIHHCLVIGDKSNIVENTFIYYFLLLTKYCKRILPKLNLFECFNIFIINYKNNF